MGLKEMLATYQAKAYRAIQDIEDERIISSSKAKKNKNKNKNKKNKHRKNSSESSTDDNSSFSDSSDYIDTTFPQLDDYQLAVNGAPFSRKDITPHDPIFRRINEIVQQNNLHEFYDNKKIANIVKLCHSHNYNHIADLFKFPSVELAVDLCALALYDIIILADDSGSMVAFRDDDRVAQLKRICKDVAEIATLFDDDGISIRFLNSHLFGDNLKTEKDVTNLINKVEFNGATPLGKSLESKILKPFLYDKRKISKPLLVIIITDGRPNPEKCDVFEGVVSYACEIYNKKSKIVGFEIAQVGNDKSAQQWLDYIDNHKTVGRYVDVTSDFETEQLQYNKNKIQFNYHLWLLKLMLGGIDIKYDSQDE